MTTVQRDSISNSDYGYNAALSLLIYNTTTDCYEFYAYGDWHEFACAVISGGCDGQTTMTDSRDSKVYNIVKIGTQCWMAENLAYLPAVHDNSTFDSRGTSSLSAYGVYGYDGSDTATAKSQANYSTYGVLYNWWAAMQDSSSCNGTGSSQPECSTPVQGICPDGWHLPSHYEFTALERAICTSGSCASDFPYDESTTGYRGTNEGSKLAKDTTLWTAGTLLSNDSIGTSGFSVLPGGLRGTSGTFFNESLIAYLWSSTENATNAWNRSWNFSTSTVLRGNFNKKSGFSVRCVRN